jgi:CRISPR-associated protein Cmr2
MDRYLITLSLGPVQSLIDAARRTRDLWCGSWLLSEAARAAALVLHRHQPGCLVFPCPADPERDLEPQKEPKEEANIANILRAEVTLVDDAAAHDLCAQTKAAALARLRELGAHARSQAERIGGPLRGEVWGAQIDDILEGFTAWVQIAPDGAGYMQASQRLGSTLAARKTTRDFAPCAPLSVTGLPKSSLDGARETVLPEWPENHPARLRLGLSRGEQLDALGVIKRLAVGAEQFTAYSRIAADPWLQGLTANQHGRLVDACEPMVRLGLATRVRGNGDTYAAFPYDAQLVFDFRLDNARRGPLPDGGREALEGLRRVLNGLSRERDAQGQPVAEPVPYAVVLKADGDRMGKLLTAARSVADSRAISRTLHDFACAVRGLVQRHRGHAIYSGGDDVLALVPLAGAIECARDLAEDFSRRLGPVAQELDVATEDQPTLSVGLGIGHLMEPLGSLRARADRAEKRAKADGKGPERNALAITLGIRSGGDHTWRAQWNDAQAHDDLKALTDAYRTKILPSRIAFDLRDIDRRLAWLREDQGATAHGIRRAEVARMLDRARTEGGAKAIPTGLRDLLLDRAETQLLADLAETLIVARWLAARTAADLGESQ